MPSLRFRRENDSLFSINHNEIKRALSEANAPLVLRSNELIQKALSVSYDEINNSKLIEIKDIISEVKTVLKELSKTRIKDGKPLTNAVLVVKEFFAQYENNLKTALDTLSSKAIEIHETLIGEANASVQNNQIVNNEFNTHSIANTNNGVSIISTITLNDDMVEGQEGSTIIEDINHKWAVENFNRDALDYEILKVYLTDSAIKNALSAHLKENGPNILNGVNYKKILN
jgi:hypothetical protein